MYEVKIKNINDSDKFRQSAIHFTKFGYYTAAPRGTSEYKKYWDEELKRCIYGFEAEDGDHISGYFYFYLNYCRISVTKEDYIKDGKGISRRRSYRFESFPDFYDYDWTYFNSVEEAEECGKHMVVLKKRGAGFSYKGASMLCRNFYCIPRSKSYAIASEMEFLTKDGLLTKAWDMMNFVDANTAFGKKRQKIDRSTHKRSSFVYEDENSGVKIEGGWGSEIIGVSLKNDPQKARGKRGKLILWEEAGKFPNLKQAWQITRPSVEDGNIAFGLMIAYGTGGTVGSDYAGLKDLFYEPNVYNALPFKNIWSETPGDNSCGFFVPWYYNIAGKDENGNSFMDENGNSNLEISIKWSIKERQDLLKASDRNTIDIYVAERPFTPEEATLQLSGNLFPKKELLAHLNDIRVNKSLSTFKQVGELYFDKDNIVKFRHNLKLKDLTTYRIDKNQDTTGAIVIWEHPNENPPYGLYIMGCDPYDHDSSTTSSLGSVIVYKRFQNFESYYDLPVAEYTGRPDTADEFYENVRRLCLYYNALILYENEKKGIFSYFSNKNCEYLLADQPDIIKDIISNSKVSRGKGIHMPKEIKAWGETLVRDWLNEEFADGRKNLTKIFSEPLIEELIAFNMEGNFDRVMAFILVMIYRQELYKITVKKREDKIKKDLFDKPLFRYDLDLDFTI
jgi:hypothetical protein